MTQSAIRHRALFSSPEAPYDFRQHPFAVEPCLVQALFARCVLNVVVIKTDIQDVDGKTFGSQKFIDAASGATGNGIFFHRNEV